MTCPHHWTTDIHCDGCGVSVSEAIAAEREEIGRLRNDIHVLESDCVDGTCRACVKCCDAALEQVRVLREALEGLQIEGLEDAHPRPCFCDPYCDRHPTEYCDRARAALAQTEEKKP